jgi:predicted nucleotidyltransferase
MNDLKTVRSILSKHYNISKNPTYIFGSRANGTHRSNSDLDILINDSNINPETVSLLTEEFEESNILYKIDIVLKSRIDNEFYKKIESQLKLL